MILYESEYFLVVTPYAPHVHRVDGGHLVIVPKMKMVDRTELSPVQASELIRLTMIVGEVMKTVLTENGVPIGRINYQDNGNWNHEFHIHLYGRATNAITQKYGTPLVFPITPEELALHYIEPLTETDANELQTEILRLLATEKYQLF